jgi:ribonuclease-3
MDEGGLSRCRASLVRGETETEFAKSMHFEEYIRRSRGEELSGSISSKILEDVFESFIGAYYLDNLPDYEKIKKFIYGFFRSPIEDYKEMETFDYKSKIQEIIQSDGKTAVQFPIVEETGEGQNKMFTAQVTSNGVVLGTGRGTSSKKAQQEAAKDALEKMVK